MVGTAARIKRLPFGEEDGKAIVILEALVADTNQQELVTLYPGAYFVFRRACVNIDSIDGDLGCGILIRNILSNYNIVVLPRRMANDFFGVELKAGLSEFKTGQILIPYDTKPTLIEVTREFERAMKQI